jgi:hypothetical protein
MAAFAYLSSNPCRIYPKTSWNEIDRLPQAYIRVGSMSPLAKK